jgi:hypothetical protein
MAHERKDRFINNNLPKLQENRYNSLSDYENLPLLTLEEAVEKIIPLISRVMDYVATAKKKYNCDSTLLTRDESAAIYLYTMPIEFFSKLNITLRDPNRQVLKPWLHFLKLLMTALKQLPSIKATIWRAVNYDATLTFVEGEVYTYWDLNSCSMNINSIQPFLGESGTLFAIEAIHGKDISMFSAVPDEQEVILMPGTRVRARNQSLSFIDRLFIIHLAEIVPEW